VAFSALLDTNVLWSAALRDTLLRAAIRALYRPLWSDEILSELHLSLTRERPDITPARLARTVQLMRDHFPDACVQDYQPLAAVMQNDPGDRHVLAAAVRGGAQVIVTSNVRDFPAAACDPYNIDVQTPDTFLCHLWDLDSETMTDVLREQVAPLRNPPQTVDDLLATLERMVPQFVAEVRQAG